MKKIAKTLLLAGIILSLFLGPVFAGGSKESASASGKTVIEVWSEDRHDMEYVEAKVAEYNATNTDNIQINLTIISDNFRNMLQMAFGGGTAPDVAGINAIPINMIASTGIAMPLNDFIANSPEYQKVNDPYNQIYEGTNAQNGNIYWIPTGMRSGVRVIYNKSLLEQCGYTEIPKTVLTKKFKTEWYLYLEDQIKYGVTDYEIKDISQILNPKYEDLFK